MRLLIKGIVQGVGFRPFVYRLARELGLKGYVKNRGDGVEICIEESKEFIQRLQKELPPLAKIEAIEVIGECEAEEPFSILESEATKSATFLSPDISTCDECLEELFDPSNRRYRYPLINCTNCGPRYTIIRALPYDRNNTSMAPFRMCRRCGEEYNDPNSRFYHAQPIGCNECGPKVRLGELEGYEAIKEAARLIKSGKIVAIKGVGGFHLVCKESEAKRLRAKKRRSKKPFAVMFQSIEAIEKACKIDEGERALILSKERPIVVVKKRGGFEGAAPDIDRVGVFLPYSPIYYLLFSLLSDPLIVTSANISDEPIIKDEESLRALGIADEVLWYEREIERSCDDSVMIVADSKPIFYRLSRGFGPKSFYVDRKLPSILAVGARQKNTIALAYENSIILSPHIGDIKNVESFDYFVKVIEDFKRIYDVTPQIVACDMHPHYETSRYARELGTNVVEVQHHRAHIWAAVAEMELTNHKLKGADFVGFAWDGTGYGDDGSIWGGEVFVEDKRRYHFEPFKIAGGERAIKQIDLIAKSLMRHVGLEVENRLFNLAYEKGASFVTSSVGRLFDAVALFSGLANYQEYEGFTGLLIEKAYRGGSERYEYMIEDGVIRIDWRSLINDKKEHIPTKFLNTLAAIIEDIALREKRAVILSGGVFQNRTLLEITTKALQKRNIPYFFPIQTPINDGGIALGQVWWAVRKGVI
ncbi:MAG: carbamoyltransferase HypF [Epsilonproteobacteria bacterium]|nr:carbamoyltransferase HypF [Campylobacterota bacterium]NPA64490.1 carbamoyltransferase HypF [Campylobacterota bacterium]